MDGAVGAVDGVEVAPPGAESSAVAGPTVPGGVIDISEFYHELTSNLVGSFEGEHASGIRMMKAKSSQVPH